ncbi:MAG: rhomboid family intramembrane serine protease [Rhodanobacter denitrificans]|uniref:Rhomboid family intramembrane serine protease n=1 Tax=Rhodanobacter denitrificans TaxID=666685 RepID=A0A2W5KRJ2_9GAMM|nr:MAG: rhomboid family intramembrane serine protease [Rhodanobacter denitrificans]
MSVNLVIIAITCIVSFMAFNNAQLVDRLIFWPPAITRGREYWRLATCGLIHADGMHLLFNMITLYFFGGLMEKFYGQYIGPFGYVLFYVSALVVSMIPTYMRHKHDGQYRSLGASGAVSAVLFAFILLAPWQTIYIYVIPVPAIIYAVLYLAYTVYMNKRGGDNINHSAHLSGAIYGILFTIALEPRVIGRFFTELANPRFF